MIIMRKYLYTTAIALFWGLMCTGLLGNPLAVDGNQTVVHPQDTGAVLSNPGMGWTFHYYGFYSENLWVETRS